ncbi:hypothetical protein U9M48_031840 [Paspalum notatum var. saurae]|uniref:Myb/SANT-like domain-containing protein n=1 Tax=Paspalum notatum var. saurae TaxID=547442 RepID=A0AAQ3U3X3_PASNO
MEVWPEAASPSGGATSSLETEDCPWELPASAEATPPASRDPRAEAPPPWVGDSSPLDFPRARPPLAMASCRPPATRAPLAPPELSMLVVHSLPAPSTTTPRLKQHMEMAFMVWAEVAQPLVATLSMAMAPTSKMEMLKLQCNISEKEMMATFYLTQLTTSQNANATVVNRSTSQRSAKNPVNSQGDMDWSVPEHVSIVCSLFAEQVEKGNRPNTHLNAVGYAEVCSRFFEMTGIELTKTQLKNKWEKLKGDLTAWRKLMRRQTSTGWDHLRQTIEMDPEWWRKIKAEIPGCAKFKKGPLRNEADLTKMFDKITNDESDHWNPMTENPIIPESQEPIINLEDDFVNAECEIPNDFTSPGSDVVKEVSP